jgi:hypothetical protein
MKPLRRCGLMGAALAFGMGTLVAVAEPAVKTGKERLGDKASDEQRIDNCKVPPERRGRTARSASCARDAKATVTH